MHNLPSEGSKLFEENASWAPAPKSTEACQAHWVTCGGQDWSTSCAAAGYSDVKGQEESYSECTAIKRFLCDCGLLRLTRESLNEGSQNGGLKAFCNLCTIVYNCLNWAYLWPLGPLVEGTFAAKLWRLWAIVGKKKPKNINFLGGRCTGQTGTVPGINGKPAAFCCHVHADDRAIHSAAQ